MVWWVDLVGEEGCFFGSSCGDELAADHVQLVIPSDDKQVSPDDGLLAIADEHLLDGYW